ncbi:nickel pincer cofactor biosynthesis protein LarB [Tuberibacillus sp. Marseille-P3662]|uniref:nickel pincer cofactor biosynthesis protein LarB n=1 Tax=Tuberibacillus sp. Marseille-P3662 TaxID=1965358 RepID=UPI000A1CC6EF|nr:nickel pincer cofactor biosynthesis protein LarB [Tuberibacillus sp. Marseille-P3662]
MDNMIDNILNDVKEGTMTPDQAKKELKTYEDLGFAKLDIHRSKRQGFPEVVFGEGKTAEQITQIIQSLGEMGEPILVTRVSDDKAKSVLDHYPELEHHSTARTLVQHKSNASLDKDRQGSISILCAGTSDLPVAEEAAVTAEAMGVNVKRFYDVGVSGLHRLIDQIDTIRQGHATVVVAGMEGALPSVVGGLVSHPVFAVPTSVGYGAHFNGVSSLLSMLNACAPGISVLNIDNGFGGGYNAALVNRMLSETQREGRSI